MRFVGVWPAMTSVQTMVISSVSESRSPSSSMTRARSEIRSSPGSARPLATAAVAPSRIRGMASRKLSPCPATMAAPYSRHRGRSATGMPTSSQITSIGSGPAKCASRSGSAGRSSSSRSTIASMRGPNSAALRRVNAGATSRRSRACSAPFISDMVRRYGRQCSGTSGRW
ncbi:hypothetical protein ABT120_16720 [Nonomuraea angiospora]